MISKKFHRCGFPFGPSTCISVADAYTRECPALEADTNPWQWPCNAVLERLVGKRSQTQTMRSDNGPEFTPPDCAGQGPTPAEWPTGNLLAEETVVNVLICKADTAWDSESVFW